MSYSPKHGGNNKQTNRSESANYAVSEKATETKSKSIKRLIAVILLIVFLAGIIVAAIFLLKPVVSPKVAGNTTTTATANAQSGAAGGTQAPTVAATTGSYNSSNPVLQYSNGEIPTSGSRHDVTVETDGGVDAMEVIGNWRLDKGTVYSFDGYGRGVMLTPVENYTFAYSARNGHLIIDFDVDDGMDTEYTYVIGVDDLGKDTMTFTRDDKEYKFTKEPQQ